MKYSTSFAVVMMLLGGAANAHRHHHHHRHSGSQPRNKLIELGHIEEWDPAFSKLMDADSYMKDVKNSLDFDDEEQPRKKHHSKHILT